ncbi:hypothetical protein Tco_0431278 [Tanacetum coccineum]
MDMFCDTLHLPVETLDNPFVTPVTIEIIESFMQRVSYQGVVDKVSAFYTKFLDQPWQTMFKVFNRRLTTRTSGHDQTKINILQLFHAVVNRKNVDYAALLWNVTVRGMLISDAFLTEEIRVIDDYKEYETVFVNIVVLMNQPQPVVSTQGTHRTTPRAHRTPTLTAASPRGKKRKQSEKDEESYADKFAASMLHDDVDDSEDRMEPVSHKEHPEVVDDDENKEEKNDKKKDDEMGSLENRIEKMQTPITTTSRSPRKNLSSDKTFAQDLTDTVSPSTATTSKDLHKKRRISSKYSHLLGALHRMCRRQGYMIRDMERKATNDLIEGNLKRVVADNIIQERDAFQSKNTVIQVHPTTTTSTDTTSSADLQQQFYLKMKSNFQNQANDLTLWDVLKHKFEKSSTSNTSCRDDDFHSQRHDGHQEDDAPPEGEKRVKRHKTSKSSKSARGSSSKRSAKDSTSYVSKQQ